MKRPSKWGNFWFIAIVRAFSGAILGALAGLLFGGPTRRGGFILRHLARDEIQPVAIWFIAWSIGGAIVALFTIPHWQLPWYKGDLYDHDN